MGWRGYGRLHDPRGARGRFYDAAGLGHIVEVRRLIASGEVDVNACDDDESNTALILASQNGRPMVVAALLEAGADVDAANDNGDTPLILASLNGHGHIVDALLKAGRERLRGGSVRELRVLRVTPRPLRLSGRAARRGRGRQPLARHRVIAARVRTHASAVAKLLGAGAGVAAVDDDGNTALHRCALETTPGAVYGGGIGEVVELLIKACVDTTATNNDGSTPQQLARRGVENGTSEWQKVRCRESQATLELAEGMTVGLRVWLRDAGLANDWREFAEAGREGTGGCRDARARRFAKRQRIVPDADPGEPSVPRRRAGRALRGGAAQAGHMGERHEAFLKQNKLEEYINHFGALGVAFERDLLDITEQQLELMVDRHGLKILDRRRSSKAPPSLGAGSATTQTLALGLARAERERAPSRARRQARARAPPRAPPRRGKPGADLRGRDLPSGELGGAEAPAGA